MSNTPLLNVNDPTKEYYKTVIGNPAIAESGMPDDVRNITVFIEPMQSGSGNPYPPGGGKNQCPVEVESNTVNGVTFTVNQSAGTVTVTGTASTTTVFYLHNPSNRYTGSDWILSGCPAGGNYQTFCLKMFIHPGNGYVSDIGSGISFSGIDNLKCGIVVYEGTTLNQAVFRPMIRLASNTDPTFAPYSNVRPISGVSSVSVTRTGKNLLPFGSASFTLSQGVILPATISPGTYTLSASVVSSDTDSNDSLAEIGGLYIFFTRNSRKSITFTLSVPVSRFSIYAGNDWNRSQGDTATWSNIQLEAGDIATDYEAPNPQTVTVQLTDGSDPLTVYGGTLDVTTGLLTVTHKEFIPDPNGQYSVDRADSYPIIRCITPITDARVDNDDNYIGWICNRLRSVPGNASYASSPASGDYVGIGTSKTIRFKSLSNFTTVAEFKAWLAENPLQVVYELAEPLTYQLTPQQLSSLEGINNFTSSNGQVAVTYRINPSGIALPE